MSKLNSTNKSAMPDGERLAGGFGALAAEQCPIDLLRRATLANLLWEDVACMDGAEVTDEIARLIPLCAPYDVFNLAIEVRLKQKLRHTPLFIAVEMCKHDGHRELVGTLLLEIPLHTPTTILPCHICTDKNNFLPMLMHDGQRSTTNCC